MDDSTGITDRSRLVAWAGRARGASRLLMLLTFAAGSVTLVAHADSTVSPASGSRVTATVPPTKLAKKTGGKSQGSATGADSSNADDPPKGDKSGKPGAGKGSSLDNLMTDVVSDDKSGGSKGKKRDDKEMDALLKDVQKTDPAPVVKKAAPPPPAPPLSPADISAVMAQVKVRGKACAQRFGRGGTAELKVTVAKDGKITDVQVGGKLVGTPVAGCLEQVVKSASFRPNAGLRFDYRMDVR